MRFSGSERGFPHWRLKKVIPFRYNTFSKVSNARSKWLESLIDCLRPQPWSIRNQTADLKIALSSFPSMENLAFFWSAHLPRHSMNFKNTCFMMLWFFWPRVTSDDLATPFFERLTTIILLNNLPSFSDLRNLTLTDPKFLNCPQILFSSRTYVHKNVQSRIIYSE